MERKFKFCVRCRRTITDSELSRGLHVDTPEGMFCGNCAQLMDERPAPASPVPPPAPLQMAAATAKPKPADPPPAVTVKPSPPPKPEPASPTPRPDKKPMPPPETPPATPRPEKKPAPAQDLAPDRIESRRIVERLEALREQVESIQRALLYEKASPWNIFGVIAQCLALGMLVVAGIQWLEESGSTTNILLIAVVFQMMAATLFLKGK